MIQMNDIMDKFCSLCKEAYGDVPVSITLPSRVYYAMVSELLDSGYRVQGLQGSVLTYHHYNRTITMYHETPIDDYIEGRMHSLLSGEICT